jgi:hypothetical protein
MLITIIHGGYLRYIRHFEIPPHHAGLYQLVNLIRGIMRHVSPPGEKISRATQSSIREMQHASI